MNVDRNSCYGGRQTFQNGQGECCCWSCAEVEQLLGETCTQSNTESVVGESYSNYVYKKGDSSCNKITPRGDGSNDYCHFFPKTKVGKDPKATNIAGQKFEILALGSFSFLSITEKYSSFSVLSLSASIERAGEICGATYIRNLTLSGSWLKDIGDLRVRAAQGRKKEDALELYLDNEWSLASDRKTSNILKHLSRKEVTITIRDLSLHIQIDAHRIRTKEGRKTHKMANFLNLDVEGLHSIERQGFEVGGLLGNDDHTLAMQSPTECTKKELKLKNINLKEDFEMTFLSQLQIKERKL